MKNKMKFLIPPTALFLGVAVLTSVTPASAATCQLRYNLAAAKSAGTPEMTLGKLAGGFIGAPTALFAKSMIELPGDSFGILWGAKWNRKVLASEAAQFAEAYPQLWKGSLIEFLEKTDLHNLNLQYSRDVIKKLIKAVEDKSVVLAPDKAKKFRVLVEKLKSSDALVSEARLSNIKSNGLWMTTGAIVGGIGLDYLFSKIDDDQPRFSEAKSSRNLALIFQAAKTSDLKDEGLRSFIDEVCEYSNQDPKLATQVVATLKFMDDQSLCVYTSDKKLFSYDDLVYAVRANLQSHASSPSNLGIASAGSH